MTQFYSQKHAYHVQLEAPQFIKIHLLDDANHNTAHLPNHALIVIEVDNNPILIFDQIIPMKLLLT